jgi:hypothetical protein
VLAAGTVIAVVLVAVALPALLRRSDRRRGILTSALVIVTGGAALTFAAYLAFAVRCSGSQCRTRASDAIDGVYPWWRDEHSWQWGAQLGLAGVGLALAALALALAARQRAGAKRAVRAAWFAWALWVVLVVAIPAAWEIFAIG